MLLAFGTPGGEGVAAAAKGRGSLYQRALEDYQAINYPEALQVLAQARRRPDNTPEQQVSIDLLEGVIRLEIGQPEQAEDSFRRALILNPKAQLSLEVSPKTTELLEKVRKEFIPSSPVKPQVVEQPPAPAPIPHQVQAPVISAPPLPETRPSWLSNHRVPLAIAGGGVAVVGVLSWVKAMSVAQQLKRADVSITTKEQLDGLVRQGKTFETAGWILAGAGAATALGSLLLIHPAHTAPTAMAVPTQGGAYVSLDWRLP